MARSRFRLPHNARYFIALGELMQTLGLKDENVIRQYMTDEYKGYRYWKLEEGEGISVAQMEEIQAAINKDKVVGVWFEEAEDRKPYPGIWTRSVSCTAGE